MDLLSSSNSVFFLSLFLGGLHIYVSVVRLRFCVPPPKKKNRKKATTMELKYCCDHRWTVLSCVTLFPVQHSPLLPPAPHIHTYQINDKEHVAESSSCKLCEVRGGRSAAPRVTVGAAAGASVGGRREEGRAAEGEGGIC